MFSNQNMFSDKLLVMEKLSTLVLEREKLSILVLEEIINISIG